MEQLILVDEADNELGYAEKYETHKKPVKLHRAFSVFIFNDEGQLLITKRSSSKKTWPGFWSNACCSHPRPNEPVELAAKRRLEEELGFSCDLEFLFKFIYNADYDHDWGEHELDHIFTGHHNGEIKPDEEEVDEWKFAGTDTLKKDVLNHPEKYTPWFRIALPRVLEHI